jgi:hypothetical protein
MNDNFYINFILTNIKEKENEDSINENKNSKKFYLFFFLQIYNNHFFIFILLIYIKRNITEKNKECKKGKI